jgi:xylan 1,4-beta-xylosidase
MSSMRRLTCLVVLGVAAAFAQPVTTISIDPRAPGKPFPHFWEQMFGSGRANLSLRDSYRSDLRAVKGVTGMRYVRFHAILDDENGFYSENAQGQPVYNWTYIDQIYDGLLENGVRPFVELSFMPRQLASRDAPHPFWYHPNVAPPKDWDRWGQVIEAFTRHLVQRYGGDETASWYFEVWNEPNIDFWAGRPQFETYMHLYAEAARAVKRVSPRLRVGGPATAQAAWVDRFIEWCAREKLPADFVSTHAYANDTSQDLFGTNEAIPRREMIARAARKVYDQVKRSARPDLPIIWSEFNATYKNEVPVTDSPFMGPWMANTIRECDGLATIMSYWSFSDVFEEQGVAKTPFYGGYGLVAVGDIPKAAFNDFRLLHELGSERLANPSDSAIVTRRADGTLAIAVWNYFPPEQAGTERRFRLEFAGAVPKLHMRVVDREHGSALTAWEAMGSPAFPSRRQLQELRKAAELAPAVPIGAATITLPPHALALIETR